MLGGIDSYTRYITKVVKAHDRELYARRSHLGHVSIFRKAKRWDLAGQDSTGKFFNLVDAPHHVFALTDNWSVNGKPRTWGGEVVLRRLQKLDSWNREQVVDEIIDQMEEADRIKQKDFRNQTEAFFADKHSVFKEAFKDIRTSGMDMSERKRRRREKKLEIIS